MLSDAIYEAAYDAELFEGLPELLASAVGARSAVLHWTSRDTGPSVSAMNGHFSVDDMALFERDFQAYDLWTDAVLAHGNANRIWRMSDLVPEAVYRRGVLYNEWSRAIGDDTLHCLGGAMKTSRGEGCLGLHRGEGAGDFGPDAARLAQQFLRPLERVLSMRSAIEAERERADTFAQFFHAQPVAAILVDRGGAARELNRAAEELIRSASGPVAIRGAEVRPVSHRDAEEWKTAVCAATQERSASGSTLGMTDAKGVNWIADFAPLPAAKDIPGHVRAMVTLRCATRPVDSDPTILFLQAHYRLTSAEACVAAAVARGDSPAEIARARGTSRETVRSQLKQVMGKLGVRRQSGIAALVATIS